MLPFARHSFRAVLLFPALLLVALGVTAPQPVMAQLNGNIADKPIAIGYMRNVTPKRAVDYVMNLTEQMEIGETTRRQMSEQDIEGQLAGMQPRVEQPAYGIAWYMVTGLIPTFESISFQPIVDEADARRLLNAAKTNYGDNGYFEELGNGCFKTGFHFSNTSEVQEGFDESQIGSNDDSTNRGWRSGQKIIVKDGKKYLETTQSFTEYNRVFDGVLFTANFEELLEMELPSSDSVSSYVNRSEDLGFDAYLDRIPVGIRQLGWNMLTAAVGTQLQQYDDEPETQYNVRRSSGDLGLALVKAVLFDIDNSSGWMRFASDGDDSLRGELRIRARKSSALSGQLTAAAGLSDFAPVLSDNAAATFHVCIRFPEEAPAALLSVAAWMQETVDRETNSDPAMKDAAQVVSETIAGIAEHRNLELLLKAGWSTASGGVFYGGLQVNENPALLRSLHHFVTKTRDAPPEVDSIFAFTEDDGRPMIRITIPAEVVESVAGVSGMHVTHIYLIHEGRRLWFAAGAENAHEIIRQSIDRCNEGGLAYRTPLLSAKIDMERWLSYPQEDPSGIAPLPHWLDENSWWFPPTPMAAAFGLMNNNAGIRPQPIMQRVYDLGGAQQAGFTVEADESGVLLRAYIGLALANHMLARMIESQEAMLNGMQDLQMEAVEAAEGAAAATIPSEAP